MKKNLFAFIAIMALMVGFTACNDDDDDVPWDGAIVEVKVEDSHGDHLAGETVYMFKDINPDASTDISTASRREITNNDGKAKFTLYFNDLNITESKTKLYFAVYQQDGDEVIFKKSDEVTVKRNEEKKITIKLSN